MCQLPKPSERLAERLLANALGVSLERWDTCGRQHAVDYHIAERGIAIEVRRITGEEYQTMHHQWNRYGEPWQSPRLARSWYLVVEAPTYGVPLAGDYERTDFRTLLRAAEEYILELEERGIHQVGRDSDWIKLALVESPAVQLRALLNDGSATSFAVDDDSAGRIEVALAYGHVVSGDADPIVDLIDGYLNGDTKQAINLRDKLARDDLPEKHAFLCVDPTVGVWHAMNRWHEQARLPRRVADLPSEIDQVWLAGYGTILWSCRQGGPWTSMSIDAQGGDQ